MARLPDHTSADRAAGHTRAERVLEAATERLRVERDESRVQLVTMTGDLKSLFAASEGSNSDDEHDPEGQTIAYERSQLSALIEGAKEHREAAEAMRQTAPATPAAPEKPALTPQQLREQLERELKGQLERKIGGFGGPV